MSETRDFPFSDAEHHSVANHLGIWTFLTTEILFFGGMFASYSVYRWFNPQAFALGSEHLIFWVGTVNTGLLLTSSLFMALADLAVKAGERRRLAWFLIAAWALGAVFLALKGYEYYRTAAEHHVPGAYFGFHWDGPDGPQVELFMVLYFAMTGLHAVHMLFGLGAVGWLIWLNHRGRLTPQRHEPVAMVALYWHFVDCVWVFLYPLLYLIR